MEIKTVFICLVILNCLDALYTENKPEKVFDPEFSLKTDICKATGDSLEVNCSLPDGHIRPHNILFKTLNCSGTRHRGSSVNQTTSFNNCSGSNNQSTIQTTFDRLNILHCTSSDRHSCILEETTKISEKTVSLFKSHLKESDTGTYFCQYNNVSQTEDNFDLTVGNYPIGPEDITCVSVDLMDLQCSWTKSRLDTMNPLPVRYKSYFKSRPQYRAFDCPDPKPIPENIFRDDISCSISDKFYQLNDYTLCINITNCLGSRTLEHNVSLPEIVKLSPPIVTSVQVEERRIQITFGLKFTTKRTLFTIKKILYHVTYTSVYSSQVNIFNSSERNNIKVILSDLIPYTKYHVTIRGKGPETVGGNYWSRPVTNSYTTKPAAPNAVPAVPPGGFSTHSGSLNIYLKPISRKDKHAANASYKVEVNNGSGIIRVFNASWERATIENVTTLQRGSDYQISMTTYNVIGETKNATIVTIPVISAPAPIGIIVEGSGSNYTVLWNRENIREFEKEKSIVYWCHGVRSNNFCKSDLKWISVSNTHSNVTIPELTEKLGGEWLFAVSYQYIDGYNTGMVYTGMVFAKCYFSSSNEAPSAVEPFNVVVTSSTELHVTPLLYCKYTNRPLKFIVYYKETENNVKSCDKTFRKKVVTANIETSSITVRSLKKSAKYAVCLSIVTKGGPQTSDAHLVQMQDTDSKLIYIIPSVIASVLVLAGVLFLICKFRKKMQKPLSIDLPRIIQRKYEKVSISRPEYTSLKQDKYSSDSGVASNTVSADITISNSTIDDDESKNNINAQVKNLPRQNEHFTNNKGIQKAINGHCTTNAHNIIQTKKVGVSGMHKQGSSLFNDKSYVISNSGDNMSYPKLTYTSSELDDIDNYALSLEDCTKSNIKGDIYKILEIESSNKTIFDYYLSNGTENSGKRTNELNLSNSQIIPSDYISRENNFEISLLLGESSFDQSDLCNESIGESEEIHINTRNLKGIDNSNVPGYIQIGL